MIPSEGGSPIPFVRKDGGENFFISPDGNTYPCCERSRKNHRYSSCPWTVAKHGR